MNKIIILTLVLFMSVISKAQIDTTNKNIEIIIEGISKKGDTFHIEKDMSIKINKKSGNQEKTIFKIDSSTLNTDEEKHERKRIEKSSLRFEIGLNNWIYNNNTVLPQELDSLKLNNLSSINFNIRFFDHSINLYKHHLFLQYGVSLSFNNYSFKHNIDLIKNSDPIDYTNNDNRDYKTNKLVTKYVNLPIMLRFNSDNEMGDGFEIAVGIEPGYLVGTHQKQKWNENGKRKNKDKGDYNVKDWRMGYVAYLGYNDIVLFAKYYPTSFFQNTNTAQIHTISAGFLINGFN